MLGRLPREQSRQSRRRRQYFFFGKRKKKGNKYRRVDCICISKMEQNAEQSGKEEEVRLVRLGLAGSAFETMRGLAWPVLLWGRSAQRLFRQIYELFSSFMELLGAVREVRGACRFGAAGQGKGDRSLKRGRDAVLGRCRGEWQRGNGQVRQDVKHYIHRSGR